MFLGLLLLATTCSAGDVVIWPAPAAEPLSPDYEVTVEGKPVPVYVAKSRRGSDYSFALFDFSGTVQVTVNGREDLSEAAIRPETTGVTARAEGAGLRLVLHGPSKLSVEPHGIDRPLLIFAGAPELAPPDPGDPHVLFYGPGIHRPGRIVLEEGQTLYLAGGAIVKGAVFAGQAHKLRIAGRGILDGSEWPWQEGPEPHMLHLWDSRDVIIEGITVRGSYSWTVVLKRCQGVTVHNLKILNGRVPNDDGINPCNSSDVAIEDCFIRSDDDCIAIKGLQYLNKPLAPVRNITVIDSIFWADRARIFLLGHESQTPSMEGVLFKNCDIIHYSMTPFLLEPGEEMVIRNAVFRDFRIHGEGQPDLITLRPTVNKYMKVKKPGRIHDVAFRNITVVGEKKGSARVVVEGADEMHRVEDVVFENVIRYGRRLEEGSLDLLLGRFIEGIRFTR